MIITIERNEKTGRFHPFAWYEAPMPSSNGDEPVQRFKSKCHHTAGFDNEDAARAEIPRFSGIIRERFGLATVRADRIGQMTWEPSEVPAAVRWMEREA